MKVSDLVSLSSFSELRKYEEDGTKTSTTLLNIMSIVHSVTVTNLFSTEYVSSARYVLEIRMLGILLA